MKCPKCDKLLIEDGKRFFIKDGKKFVQTFGICFGTVTTHINTVFIPIWVKEIDNTS